jgi:hypothetical protein
MAEKDFEDRDPEAVVYATVFFKIQRPNQEDIIREEPCLLDTSIAGLKEEKEDPDFGPSEHQTWYYKDELMDDDENLKHYRIDGSVDIEIIVRVLE